MKKNNSCKKATFDTRYLISCDLDGTLLNSKGKLSEYSKKVVAKLSSLGHLFCINTARPFNGAAAIYEELKLQTPIVCHNGAFMFNPNRSDFPLTSWFISNELVREIIKDPYVKKYARNIIIDSEKAAYIVNKTDVTEKQFHEISDKFGIYMSRNVIKLNDKLDNFKDTVYCLLFMLKKQEDIMELINAIRYKVPTLVTSIWKLPDVGAILFVHSPYCSKANALQLLSSYFGIPETRVYAFGDGLDDAEMLKFASHGYAMKNGSNEAQIKANFVTHYTNDQDGVALTLNKKFGLGINHPKIKYK